MSAVLALAAPAWVQAARRLAEVTHAYWPEDRRWSPEDHDEDCDCFDCGEDKFEYKCFAEDPCDAILEEADEEGFYLLGCGHFTAVFGHEDFPDMVFKLNAGTMDGMQDYHVWLMTQDHPNLPRVYHVEPYDEGCVAVGERLDDHGAVFHRPEEGSVFEEAYRSVRWLLNANGFYANDLHGANFMMRGDTVVVNDPTSG